MKMPIYKKGQLHYIKQFLTQEERFTMNKRIGIYLGDIEDEKDIRKLKEQIFDVLDSWLNNAIPNDMLMFVVEQPFLGKKEKAYLKR